MQRKTAVHRVKMKGSEKRYKYLDLSREMKRLENESDSDTNCNWYARYSYQRIDTGSGRLSKKMAS